jgi:hypothetical protein
LTELFWDALLVAGMASPLWGFGAVAALWPATGRGSKGGLRSGRNVLRLQDLDRELIGTRDGLGFEPPELGLEGREILDRAVDRREHDGRYTVQPREPAKRELAHPFGRSLAAFAPDCRLDRSDDLVEPLGLDRSLGRRPLKPAEELVAVERLAATVALYDVHAEALRALVGREALVAVLALPPSANGVSRLAGVHDAMLGRSAVGALHGPSILLLVVESYLANHKILWKFRPEDLMARPDPVAELDAQVRHVAAEVVP